MNYCKYKYSDGQIVEISSSELVPEGEYLTCMANIENSETHNLYVVEVIDNILISYKGYVK